jgi:hypothetical protein
MNACVVLLIVTILPTPTRQKALVSNFLQSWLQHFLITLRLSRKNLRHKNFCRINFQSRRRNPTPTYKTKKPSKEEERLQETESWNFKLIFSIKTHPHTRVHTQTNCWIVPISGQMFLRSTERRSLMMLVSTDFSRENERNEWQGEKQ